MRPRKQLLSVTRTTISPDIEVDASTLTEDQWQARRADHLGGSDISAIFGENHFKTNLDLYYSKTGKVPAVQEEESSASRLNKLWGHISEEYVDAWLSEKYPYNDIITDTNIYAMPGRPYITANIDRMMRKPDGSYCLVEIKTTEPVQQSGMGEREHPDSLHLSGPYLHGDSRCLGMRCGLHV